MSIDQNREIKVSVIMPIYNAGEYLSRAIGDVLAQTLSDIELICVDDGSTDNSPKIIADYEKKDERVSSVRQSNQGPSVARNKGLEYAHGRYIIFLDADDMYEPSLLESLYSFAEEGELDIAISGFDIYDESQNKFVKPTDEPHSEIFNGGKITSKNEHPDKIFGSASGYAWNKLLRADFMRDKKLMFDPDLYVFEDVHFSASVMALAERVARVDDVLIHHRVYSDQSRATLFRKYYGQVPVVYSKIREFLMHHGMYVPLKRGYLNYSAGRCYKIYNLLWAGGKERLWNMLHTRYINELDWLSIDKDEYEQSEVCEFVANVALYPHDEHLDRSRKGTGVNFNALEKDEISNKVKSMQKTEQRKENLKKTFGLFNMFKKK